MLRTKKDVDRHVKQIEDKIPSEYERNLKGFTLAKLYLNVGDLESAKRYLTKYLNVRENSSLAYKLNGEICESQRLKEKALASYKRAIDLDHSQRDLIIKICQLTQEVSPFDAEKARYWVEQGEKTFPNNKVVIKLRERITAYEGNSNGVTSGEVSSNDQSPEHHSSSNNNHDCDNSVIYSNNSGYYSVNGGGNGTLRNIPPEHSTPVRRKTHDDSLNNSIASGHRRFAPRPSPERLAAQMRQLEMNQESLTSNLFDKLSKLETDHAAITKLITSLLDEVKQCKTISQNVATEMTLLKKDLKERDEERVKEIKNVATTAATSAATAVASTVAAKKSEITEQQTALQQAALLQITAAAGYGMMRQPNPALAAQQFAMMRPDLTIPQPQQQQPQQQPPPPPPQQPLQQHQPTSFDHLSPPKQGVTWPSSDVSGDSLYSTPSAQPRSNSVVKNETPTNIVISTSDKIPSTGGNPIPVFSGSVTIPAEHRLGVKPNLPSHGYQINLPQASSTIKSSPFANNDGPAVPITTTSILSTIPAPTYSAVTDSPDSSHVFTGTYSTSTTSRQRQISVSSQRDGSYVEEEEHDPCPDFKPIIPLPEEVEVVTGEEDEEIVIEVRLKLYRFKDKEWKERGVGQLKILKHKTNSKFRVLMRRDHTLKICANHFILPEIKIEFMKNQNKALTWAANDFSDEEVKVETFCARFKTPDEASTFLAAFEKAKSQHVKTPSSTPVKPIVEPKLENLSALDKFKPKVGSWECPGCLCRNDAEKLRCPSCNALKPGTEAEKKVEIKAETKAETPKFGLNNMSFGSLKPTSTPTKTSEDSTETKPSPFSGFSFGTSSTSTPSFSGFTFGNIKSEAVVEKSPSFTFGSKVESTVKPTEHEASKDNESYVEEEHDPCPDFKPIIPLPKEVDVVTGEENEEILFEERCKLFRFINKEWKERGLGQIKILKHKENSKIRILMRREQTLKVCANHFILPEIVIQKMKNQEKAVTWSANDFSDEEVKVEMFCARFKNPEQASAFMTAFEKYKNTANAGTAEESVKDEAVPKIETLGSLDKFKPKPGSWECPACCCRNDADKIVCPACNTPQPGKEEEVKSKSEQQQPAKPVVSFGSQGGFVFSNLKTPSTPSTSFTFGSTITTPTTTKTPFKLREDVKEEHELSFENQSLKLNTENDAKEVAEKIKSTKDMHILTFSGNTIGIEAAKAIGESLKSHPEFRRAHWKDMFTGRMKTEIPPALVHLSNGIMFAGAQLVELDLSDNAFGPIGMEGLKDLLKSQSCYTLKELRLNNTGCGVTGGKYLAELLTECFDRSTEAGHPLALKVFVLGRSRQENEGAKALSKIFKKMGSLEEVVMPQNGIYHEGIDALMDAFSNNSKLRILNMNDNTFTLKGAQSLAKALPKMPDLEVLNIGDCLLKTDGATTVAEALKAGHSKLKELYMDSNEITIKGGVSVVDAIANKSQLTKLVLDSNQFGEKGCKKILKKVEDLGKKDVLGDIQDDEEPDDDEDAGDEEVVEEGNQNKTSSAKSVAGIFGGSSSTSSTNIFSGISSTSSNLFGGSSTNSTPIFGAKNDGKSIFNSSSISSATTIFGGDKSNKESATPSIFGGTSSTASTGFTFNFNTKKEDLNESPVVTSSNSQGVDLSASKSLPSFASLSGGSSGGQFAFGKKDESFSFANAGASVFGNTTSDKNNDTTEDEEHDPHFEPVVPLPELVHVTTGEEEEEVLFKHRAKVYRFDSETKQWKERGVGDIKILKHPSKNTYRILLRRDQIHKVACNHLITKEMDLKPLSSSETSLCWYAMDFADDEAKLEHLAVRFKHAETKDEFKKVFEECQSKLGQPSTPVVTRASLATNEDDSGEDYEDEETDGDDGESPMFLRTCQFFEIRNDAPHPLGEVELRVIYDDDFYGARIVADSTAEQDDEEGGNLCNHLIAVQTCLQIDNVNCSWSAYDFSTDPPSYRSFRATFKSEKDAHEFKDAFYEGKEFAEQSEILEKPQQQGGRDGGDEEEYYYGSS